MVLGTSRATAASLEEIEAGIAIFPRNRSSLEAAFYSSVPCLELCLIFEKPILRPVDPLPGLS